MNHPERHIVIHPDRDDTVEHFIAGMQRVANAQGCTCLGRFNGVVLAMIPHGDEQDAARILVAYRDTGRPAVFDLACDMSLATLELPVPAIPTDIDDQLAREYAEAEMNSVRC